MTRAQYLIGVKLSAQVELCIVLPREFFSIFSRCFRLDGLIHVALVGVLRNTWIRQI